MESAGGVSYSTKVLHSKLLAQLMLYEHLQRAFEIGMSTSGTPSSVYYYSEGI